MIQKIIDCAKTMLAGAVCILLVGGFVYQVGSDAVEWWVHRNEPMYLVSRAYDPIWKYAGFVPDSMMCSSPARCEPSGKPLLQYFVLLKEYELREWGLSPANETPHIGMF